MTTGIIMYLLNTYLFRCEQQWSVNEAGHDVFVVLVFLNRDGGQERMLEEYIDQEQIIDKLKACIAIRSVKGEASPGMPYGREVNRALEYALDLAAEMGFRTVNLDGYAGYAEYGEGDEMVAVLGHLDIVPEGDGWTHPPYEGQIAEGKIYGRGATDDKGPLIAALFALKAIKDAGMKLKHRIRIIFGTDEESGSHDMQRYKETEELPVMAFTPDADYPVIFSEKRLVNIRLTKDLTEDQGSWSLLSAKGGTVVNQVPEEAGMVLQRNREQLCLEGKGAAAHGSTPEAGKNAIDDLMKQLTGHPCFSELSEGLRSFAGFYMEYLYSRLDGSGFGATCFETELGSTTFNVGLLDGDEEKIQLTLDCRFPASMEVEEILKRIEDVGKEQNMHTEITKNKPGLYVPKNHQLVKTLQKVYEEEMGTPCEPVAIGGGTYAKMLPNTVAFGPVFPGRQNRIHEADEFISIEELILDIKMFIRAMYELARL